MLTNYVLVLANSGIRIGEARGLKWNDIEAFTSDEGKLNVVLHVKGKTGSREAVARDIAVQDYLKRIWDLRHDELGKDPPQDQAIFCHKDGKPIDSFKKALFRQNVVRPC